MTPLPKPLFVPGDFSRSAIDEADQDVDMDGQIPADLASILIQQRSKRCEPVAEDVNMDTTNDNDARADDAELDLNLSASTIPTHSFAVPALPSHLTAASSMTSSSMEETTHPRPRRVTLASSDADIVFGSENKSYRFSAWDIASWNKRLSEALEESKRKFRPLAETMGSSAPVVRGNGLGLVEAATKRVRARDVSPVKKANARGHDFEDGGRAAKKRIVGRKMSIGASGDGERPQGWVYDATISAVDAEVERSRKRSISSSPFTYGEQSQSVCENVHSAMEAAQTEKAAKKGFELAGMGLGEAPLSTEKNGLGADARMRRPTPPSRAFAGKSTMSVQ